ncbi:MAG TPA: serine/threonine-protein kinase [Drouetiella sp.]
MEFKEKVDMQLVSESSSETNEPLSDSNSAPISDSNSAPISVSNSAQSLIPGYSDFTLIAEGASGRVFQAFSIHHKKAVAVKLYKKELIPDSDAGKRFQQEVSTLSCIDHPNVVKILDFGVTSSGLSYLVMELVEGVSLRTILETDGVFQPERAAKAVREICRALETLHARGIIHRDIKPNNIILDSSDVARIVDFGIAKIMNSNNETITQYGAILGTPAYMSPEQCLGNKVDERSDVYSLGCTLFEMITGLKAFDGATAMESLAKQIDEDRSFLDKPLVSAGVSAELRSIITTCLKRDPDSRYANVTELSHELGAYLLRKPLELTRLRALNAKRRGTGGSGTSDEGADDAKVRYGTHYTVIVCLIVLVMAFVLFRSNVITTSNQPTQATTQREQSGAGTGIQDRDSQSDSTVAKSSSSGAGPVYIIYNKKTGKPIYSEKSAHTAKAAVLSAFRHHVSLQNADLRNADLGGCDLSGIDLSYADLTNARLTSATLCGAKFFEATLHNTSFVQADLSDCDFVDARMTNAMLIRVAANNANFMGANMGGVFLTESSFRHANFSNSSLMNAKFNGADLTNANMSGADFTNTFIDETRTSINDVNFQQAKNLTVSGKYNR